MPIELEEMQGAGEHDSLMKEEGPRIVMEGETWPAFETVGRHSIPTPLPEIQLSDG